MKKIINKIKKWNWTLLILMICISIIGALENKTIDNITDAIIVGLLFGIVIGIPFAIITKDAE